MNIETERSGKVWPFARSILLCMQKGQTVMRKRCYDQGYGETVRSGNILPPPHAQSSPRAWGYSYLWAGAGAEAALPGDG